MSHKAILALKDGSIFRGASLGAPGTAVGEAVFNTAMSGYQEILSDPSYARQLVCLTAAHIGNVGTNPDDMESARAHAEGLIVRAGAPGPSNWRSRSSLAAFLAEAGRPAIGEVDTRRLTRHLREHGAMGACLTTELNENDAVSEAQKFPGLLGMDLAASVSCKAPYEWTEGLWEQQAAPQRFRVTVYDFGVKRTILRTLVHHGCAVRVVPGRTPTAEVLAGKPDGVVVSNGPGDPSAASYGIDTARELLAARVPYFGICLGHQFLGLASGARTIKTPFGHHGANHPVLDLESGEVWISSQNHGFAVDRETLPDNLRATHVSLFDHTLQGAARTDVPAIGFQGHPEAGPGPHDVRPLFKRFVAMMDGERSRSADRRSRQRRLGGRGNAQAH